MAFFRQKATSNELSDAELDALRRRGRVLMLLDAAERAGITPLETTKFHAFAYLADVLSPVWHLPTFSGVILKTTGGPFYRDFQREIDHLVVAGLLEIHDLKYVDRPRDGARIAAKYSLRFQSPQLEPLLSALGARSVDTAIDSKDHEFHSFLVELAYALARLPDNEIDKAASADVAYSDPRVATNSLLEFEGLREGGGNNLSVATADRFNAFVPDGLSLSSGEKLFLYASYLGKRIHARR
jgi:hypothetical protein